MSHLIYLPTSSARLVQECRKAFPCRSPRAASGHYRDAPTWDKGFIGYAHLEHRFDNGNLGSMSDLRSAMRGDCHAHTDASDGEATIAEMAAAAAELGHDWLVITDHSPRLTIANGLSPARLRRQIEQIQVINAALDSTGFRLLTGIEVDILADGSLDQEPELLANLDVVVGSIHSGLRDDRATMTRRMTAALANPHLDILGHCTGRKLAVKTDAAHSRSRWRPPSEFDAKAVFDAAQRYDKAIEINCRPDRRDPPSELLKAAAVLPDLRFAINTDAHTVDQLAWQTLGCDRATAADISPARVINTWPAEDLLAWTATHNNSR